jgi:uncharacterized damage-inducible protein DinB
MQRRSRRCASQPGPTLVASRSGSDSRGITFYGHILGAEAAWLARIGGRVYEGKIWPTLSLDEAAALAAQNAADLHALIAPLTESDLAREIEYRNSAGREFRSTLEDILLHVALHGAYHRGQVALVIRGGGGEPIATDYIGFIRGAPAARTIPPTPVAQPR